MTHLRRHALGLVLLVCLVALGTAWAVLLRPQSIGGPIEYVIVRGGSMEPAFSAGDLAVVRATGDVRTGDVVAYRVPAGEVGGGHIVIHRVVGGSLQHGLVVQGDGNTAKDPWQPTADDVVGTVWFHVPAAGTVLVAMRQPAVVASAAAGVTVATYLTWIGIESRRRRRSTAAARLARVTRHRSDEDRRPYPVHLPMLPDATPPVFRPAGRRGR